MGNTFAYASPHARKNLHNELYPESEQTEFAQYAYPPSPVRNALAPETVGEPMLDPDDFGSAMSDRMGREMHNNAVSAGGFASNSQMKRMPWMPAKGDLSRSPIFGKGR